jgi:hypothetical protein
MARSAKRHKLKRCKIFMFSTPAGTGFGTHAGGSHLTFPNFVRHWGIMIGDSEHDAHATMVELDKDSALKSLFNGKGFAAPVWARMRNRSQREQEESHERSFKIFDTGLTTYMTDRDIRCEGTSVC